MHFAAQPQAINFNLIALLLQNTASGGFQSLPIQLRDNFNLIVMPDRDGGRPGTFRLCDHRLFSV